MYLDSKRVFLAGATGMVGNSIMRCILDNYPRTSIRAAYYKHTQPYFKHERVEYVCGDLKSGKDCQEMIKGCDCAIMAAAHTTGSAATAARAREQTCDNLVMNTQMLNAFYSERITRVVYIGSATLYQEFTGFIKENQLDLNRDPPSVYFGIGWGVRFIEKLCQFYHEKCGMEILIARAANIFGPYARFDPQTSNFIPAIIRKAVERQDPFEVWGDPEVTRDVIYAPDFARAIVMMLDSLQIKFDIFNVGSGPGTTVDTVVTLALKCARHTPSQIKYLSDKPETTKSRILDCLKLKQVLGWKPQYSIEDAIRETAGWWIENKGWWKK